MKDASRLSSHIRWIDLHPAVLASRASKTSRTIGVRFVARSPESPHMDCYKRHKPRSSKTTKPFSQTGHQSSTYAWYHHQSTLKPIYITPSRPRLHLPSPIDPLLALDIPIQPRHMLNINLIAKQHRLPQQRPLIIPSRHIQRPRL
jgi:hypothetical protein